MYNIVKSSQFQSQYNLSVKYSWFWREKYQCLVDYIITKSSFVEPEPEPIEPDQILAEAGAVAASNSCWSRSWSRVKFLLNPELQEPHHLVAEAGAGAASSYCWSRSWSHINIQYVILNFAFYKLLERGHSWNRNHFQTEPHPETKAVPQQWQKCSLLFNL
jgi:hypothetical protein